MWLYGEVGYGRDGSWLWSRIVDAVRQASGFMFITQRHVAMVIYFWSLIDARGSMDGRVCLHAINPCARLWLLLPSCYTLIFVAFGSFGLVTCHSVGMWCIVT